MPKYTPEPHYNASWDPPRRLPKKQKTDPAPTPSPTPEITPLQVTCSSGTPPHVPKKQKTTPTLNPLYIPPLWPPDFATICRAYATIQPYIDPDYPERDMAPAADLAHIDRFISLMLACHPDSPAKFLEEISETPPETCPHG